MGKAQESQVAAQQALELSTTPMDVARCEAILGRAAYKLGDIPSAGRHFKNATALQPSNASYRRSLKALRGDYAKERRIEAERILSAVTTNIQKMQPSEIVGRCEEARALLARYGGTNEQLSRTIVVRGYGRAVGGDVQAGLKDIRAGRKLKDKPVYKKLEKLCLDVINRPQQVAAPAAAPGYTAPQEPYYASGGPAYNPYQQMPAYVAPAGPDSGEAVVEKALDDNLLVETTSGYGILEVYSGFIDEGDVLVGCVEGYGLQDLFNKTKGDSVRVYIEETGLSREDALEKLVEASQ